MTTYGWMPQQKAEGISWTEEKSPCLVIGTNPGYQNGVCEVFNGGVQESMIVRRLTPVECERLQGYPDGWTEGEADTQRYKQCGNSVAITLCGIHNEKN